MTRFAALLLACIAMPAEGAIRYTLAANTDFTRTTAYPNGDKPIVSCTTPSGWTEAAVGDGGGEICEVSASEFDLNVFGSSQAQNSNFVYKDCGGADCQIEARIGVYTGSTEQNASTGVGIRESTAQSAWFMQCHSLQSGATAVQCTYGSAGTYTNANCAPGETRPIFVGVSYDDSESDVRGFYSTNGSSWTECVQTTRNLSDDLVYDFGASKSATVTLASTHDNIAVASSIDFYTPGPAPTGPTLVSEIANQTAAQGATFSLSCAANWTGATSYSMPSNGSAGGFATGTGLSFNTNTCAFSGIPNANDIGTRTITVTAVNASGSTPESFELVVSADPGSSDVFTIPVASAARTYNCGTTSGANGANWSTIRTSGSGTRPGAGDTIQFAGGNHGRIVLSNCVGSDSNRIQIRPVAGQVAAIQKGSGGSGSALNITNSINFDFTGGNDDCGVQDTWPAKNTTHNCGFVVELGGTTVESTHFVRIDGTSSKFSFSGVEIDATGGTSGIGICLSINDHTLLATVSDTGPWPASGTYNGEWREDIDVTNNWVHGGCGNNSGEAMYMGPNSYGQDGCAPTCHDNGAWPQRNFRVSYNQVEDSDRSSIRVKYVQAGTTNSVDHNYIENAGTEAIAFYDGGDVRIHSNIIVNAAEAGIEARMGDPKGAPYPDPGPFYVYMYNNIINVAGGYCLRVAGSSPTAEQPEYSDLRIYNNTCIETDGIQFTSTAAVSAATRVARDNILAGAAAQQNITGGTATSNTTGTVASQAFVNTYKLSASSPACNVATNDTDPALDYEDEARDQDGRSDDGADEAAACP